MSTIDMVNDNNDGNNDTDNNIQMKDYSFLPYFTITLLDRTKKQKDIEDALNMTIFNPEYNTKVDNGDNRLLDMTQLKRLVSIKVSSVTKSKAGTTNEEKAYVQADFDYCKHEDFLLNNYTDLDYNYGKYRK